MTLKNKGISTLVVTCAFAMFAIAAIPTQAKAYYNGLDVSYCSDVFCGDFYSYGNDYGGNAYFGGIDFGFNYIEPISYSYPQYYSYPTYSYQTYSYPTYTYSYPTIVQSPRRSRYEQDFFARDWNRAARDWNAESAWYQNQNF